MPSHSIHCCLGCLPLPHKCLSFLGKAKCLLNINTSFLKAIKSKNLKWGGSSGNIYFRLPSFCSPLCVSLTLLSHSVSIPPLPWQTAPPAFFMFGCCRRGINLLFVAVNQISTDRFKLIASVSWSQKKTVLQAVISFYFPSDILINDMCTQFVSCFMLDFKCFCHICKIYLTPAEFLMTLSLCKM